jgi:hypothetical protein
MNASAIHPTPWSTYRLPLRMMRKALTLFFSKPYVM